MLFSLHGTRKQLRKTACYQHSVRFSKVCDQIMNEGLRQPTDSCPNNVVAFQIGVYQVLARSI